MRGVGEQGGQGMRKPLLYLENPIREDQIGKCFRIDVARKFVSNPMSTTRELI